MATDDMNIPEPVTVSELRADLRRILETAHYFSRRYVILRNGDAVAVLVGLEDFRQLVGAPGAPADVDRR
jgi:PHD/YefM family antitoxin component YafN of YafNO toxin-antitoxin module